MIRVTIELISAQTGKTSSLGMMEINNDGTGTQSVSNYDVAIFKDGQEGVWKTGHLERFKRGKYGPWHLLMMGLFATLGESLMDVIAKKRKDK